MNMETGFDEEVIEKKDLFLNLGLQDLSLISKSSCQEIQTWLLMGLERHSGELLVLLEKFEQCVLRKDFGMLVFDSIFFGLTGFLKNVIRNEVKGFDEVILKALKLIFLLGDKRSLSEKSEKVLEDIENRINETLSWVNIKDWERNFSILEIIIAEILMKNKVVELIIKRKGAQVYLNRTIQFFYKHFSELSKDQTEICIKFTNLLVENDIGNFERLEKVYSIILKSTTSEQIIKEIFKSIEIGLNNYKSSENFQKLKKIYFVILLSKSVSSKLAFTYYSKLKAYLDPRTHNETFTSDIKPLILKSKSLKSKDFLLDIIYPSVSKGFSQSEYKLMLRQCTLNSELTENLFNCILKTFYYTKESNDFFKVGGSKLIRLSLNYSVCGHKEFVFWMKFKPDILPQHLMNIMINKSVFLYFFITIEGISVIHKGKNNKQKKLADLNFDIKEKKWNSIGIFFNLTEKNKNNHCLLIDVNKLKVEVSLNKVERINNINLVEFTGTGSLEILCMYSKFITNQEFLKSNLGSSADFRSYEVFRLTSQIPFPKSNYIKEIVNNSELSRAVSLDSIICSIQSINLLLPLLLNSDSSSTFHLFFQIISSLSNYPNFSNLIDEKTFPILGYILSKKHLLPTIETLTKIQDFLQSFSQNPKYSQAYEYLILIPYFWIQIQESDFICFLEILKTFTSHLKSSEIKKVLNRIFNFFEVFKKLGKSELKPAIFYYYYNLFSIIIKKAYDEDRLEVIRDILCFLMTDQEIDEVEFSLLIVEVQNLRWKSKDSVIVKDILGLLIETSSKLGERLTGDILKLVLNVGKNYYISLESEEKNECFLKELGGLFLNVDIIISKHFNWNLCKIICDFLISNKLENSRLLKIAEIITKLLVSKYETCENLLVLIEKYCKQYQHFSLILSKQSDFPGWIIKIIATNNQFSQSLLNITAIIFSNISSFPNFNTLRYVLIELKKLGNFSAIFQILKEIYLIGFMLISLKSEKTIHLLEFYNLLEDIVCSVPYDKIPLTDYLSLVKSIIIHLKCFPFSQKFLSITGLYFLQLRTCEKENEKIVKREGGIARQVLIFVLYAMSFGQDSELENFLLSFVKAEARSQVERKEHELVSSCESVEGLITLFIYTEWVEIIKVYYYWKIGHEEISASIENLTKFLQTSKIWKTIKREIHCSLDYKGIKVLNSILKEKFNFLHFDFIPDELSEKYKNTKFVKSALDIINDETKFIGEKVVVDYRKMIKIYAENLKAFSIMGKVKDFIESFLNETKVTLFFKGLTTFKVITFSKYYVFLNGSNHELNYFINYLLVENSIIHKINRVKFDNQLDYRIEKDLKELKNILNQFIGIFYKQTKEKKFLRSNVDFEGKLNYVTQPKYKSNEIKTELEPPSEKSYDSIESCLDQVCSINNEFECEIIYIKGTLYGKLTIDIDHMVFNTIPKRTPKIPPSLNFDNYGQVLFSSSLPETQLHITVRKYFLYSEIKEIIRKKFIHNLCAIEIYLNSGKSYLINFFNTFVLEKVHLILKDSLIKSNTKFLDKTDLPKYQKKWLQGKTTNFEYLLILNKYASRSFNSLSHYPIFPWVLKYLETETLDLNNDSIYRDLYYPVCAQNLESRKTLQNNFGNSKSDLFGQYHFGSHYSTGALILNYLIRIEPFTSQNRVLHENSFDLADRIFYSMQKLWSATQALPSDPKELIPQFFYLPELFQNKNNEKFGHTQSGLAINDIILPTWAKKNVYVFLYFHRKVLESEFVSKNLNHWIDLVFGCRQDGDKAVKDCNLFHPVTYTEKYKEIIKNGDEDLKKMVFSQAFYYGQIPEKLFDKPHLVKKSKPKILFDGLFENFHFKFAKRKILDGKFLSLSSSKYFIILKLAQTVSCWRWEWPDIGKLNPNYSKKVDLFGIYPTSTFTAVVFKNLYIVSAGHPDNSIIFHNFSGQILKIYNFHSNTITSLIGGKCIISSSLDSSIVFWTQLKTFNLYGHIGPVQGLTYIHSYCLIGSFSDYFLIHDSRTGEVLIRIKENICQIFSNCFGMFFITCKNQLKVLYLNGDWVKVFEFYNQKLLGVNENCLFVETFNGLEVWHLFEESKRKVLVQGIEDIEGVICCKNTDGLVIATKISCMIMVDSKECK